MITVFGSINIDLIVEVARLPAPGETVRAGALRTLPGGKGANQALAAARAGGRVRLVGAVGADAFADLALAECRAGGVDLGHVRRLPGATGTAMILVAEGGENVIAIVAGANGALRPQDVTALGFAAGDVLLAQLETPLAAVAAAMRAAAAAGATVVLNPVPFEPEAVDLMELVDVLVVNRGEAAALAATAGLAAGPAAETVDALARRFGCPVVATLGPEGAVAAVGAARLKVPALAVAAVDTVGAGDTFCGYLAAALAAGPLDAGALRLAAAAASLACTRPGAQTAIPARADVLAALAEG